MDFRILSAFSESELRAIASSLRDGALSRGISKRILQDIARTRTEELVACFQSLEADGLRPHQIAHVVEAAAQGMAGVSSANQLIDLVLSGPGVEEVPMGNTAATMHSLVTSTNSQLLLVGYALHGGKQVFKTLAERMDHDPVLDVTFCLDIQKGRGDERQPDELVAAFKKRFIKDQWPGERLPKVYYDPRSLGQGAERACLHAKVVVVDQKVSLITSANFTEAAQERNIELGALLRDHRIAQRIHQHFQFLIDRQTLLPVID